MNHRSFPTEAAQQAHAFAMPLAQIDVSKPRLFSIFSRSRC